LAVVIKTIVSKDQTQKPHDSRDRSVESESSPSLDVERREGLERSLAREELEAALRVLDPPHAERPHQEVEAVHEECAEHRSLDRRQNGGSLNGETDTRSI